MKPPESVIDLAIRESVKSACVSKRGVVIWAGEHDSISYGYNHKPGQFVCDGSEACKKNCGKDAVHAEQHAILGVPLEDLQKAQMLHVKTVDGVLVPSMGPSCLQCSKLILEVGIEWMWLFHHVNEDRPDGWKRYSAAEFHYLSGAYVPRKKAE